MHFTTPVSGADLGDTADAGPDPDIQERLAAARSAIPAVTHVDGSARVQTVDSDRAAGLHRILSAFHELTGCPVLVNTSFNVRGEPIVHTPEDANRCFMTTEMDWLLLEDCLLNRRTQPAWRGTAIRLELD